MKHYKEYFKQSIEANYPRTSKDLLLQIEHEFNTLKEDVNFANTSQNLVDRRLLFTSYFLAFIKVLDKQGESYEKIREISLQIVT